MAYAYWASSTPGLPQIDYLPKKKCIYPGGFQVGLSFTPNRPHILLSFSNQLLSQKQNIKIN